MNKIFRIIENIFLHVSFNICFGFSKEQPHCDGSFEYPQHMFWLRNKKIIFLKHTLNLSTALRQVEFPFGLIPINQIGTLHKLRGSVLPRNFFLGGGGGGGGGNALFSKKTLWTVMTLVKSVCVTKYNFLIYQPKHMLWVLKRTISMREPSQ